LAGGLCRMPVIEEWLQEFFGKDIEIKKAKNVEQVVSLGAAIMAHNINMIKETIQLENHKPLNVIESLNYSLGIEVNDNKMGWILRQGTVIPTKGVRVFTNPFDNVKGINITLKQGASELAAENKTIYSINLPIAPALAGKAHIRVSFEMDNNQMLTVRAQDISISDVVEIDVKLPGRIEQEDIGNLANGQFTLHRPTEAELRELTKQYYRAVSKAEKIGDPEIRKQQLEALRIVELSVLGYTHCDAHKIKTKLDEIEAFVN